jgi:hypothetical protein
MLFYLFLFDSSSIPFYYFLFYSLSFFPSFLRWLLLPISLPFTYHLSWISILMYPAFPACHLLFPCQRKQDGNRQARAEYRGGYFRSHWPGGVGAAFFKRGHEKSVQALSRLLSWTNSSISPIGGKWASEEGFPKENRPINCCKADCCGPGPRRP